MSQNRILPAASNQEITTVWAKQQMDRPIKLIALRTKVSQMATRRPRKFVRNRQRDPRQTYQFGGWPD